MPRRARRCAEPTPGSILRFRPARRLGSDVTPSRPKAPAVYILASKRNGTLYVGVTSDLARRIWEHRNDVADGFSGRYGTHMLVYVESHESMEGAITREKQIKAWRREWKLALIERENPEWKDLYEGLL